jgi:TorA maturation chaperone TorD
MDAHEQALARSRAYALLARLFRDGLTADLLPAVAAVPALTDALPRAFDADEAAADHYQLLHLDVPPCAGLFLDAPPVLGGPAARAAQHHYRQAGLAPETGPESPDHLGRELAFLAFLTGAEADALEDGLPAEAARLQPLQRRFLGSHLLWWLPAVEQALAQGPPFYQRLARLTRDLALDHLAALGHAPESRPPEPAPPDLPPLLDQPGTGLHEIAAYLTTPAWSGLYLGRTDAARLGRGLDLPRGFGGRTRMLTNLLHAAVTYDRLGPLLDDLLACVETWAAAYHALAAEAPALPAIARHWLDRLARTKALLLRLREAAPPAATPG